MNEIDGTLSSVKYITRNEPNRNKIIIRFARIRSKIETVTLKRNMLQVAK